MRFLANSQLVDGVTRELFAEYVEDHPLTSSTWELVRNRVVTEYAFKVGDVPGVVFFMEVDDEADAHDLVSSLPVVSGGLLTFQIDPVRSVAHF